MEAKSLNCGSQLGAPLFDFWFAGLEMPAKFGKTLQILDELGIEEWFQILAQTSR